MLPDGPAPAYRASAPAAMPAAAAIATILSVFLFSLADIERK
jgi:hypothetical protein